MPSHINDINSNLPPIRAQELLLKAGMEKTENWRMGRSTVKCLPSEHGVAVSIQTHSRCSYLLKICLIKSGKILVWIERDFKAPTLAEELLAVVSWEKSHFFLGMCPMVQWMAPFSCTNSIQWIPKESTLCACKYLFKY